MDKPIVIYVSEIAKLIRSASFTKKDITNTVDNIWKRNYPSTYKSNDARKAVYKMNRFISGNTVLKQSVTRPMSTMTPEDSVEMMKSYENAIQVKEDAIKRSIKQEIQTITGGDITEIQKMQLLSGLLKGTEIDIEVDLNNIVSMDELITVIDTAELTDKKHILEFYQSTCRTTLGTVEESTVEDLYKQKTGKTIQENNSQTFAQKYKTRNDLRFVVRGRIDGLVTVIDKNNKPSHKLIEIKNRTARLFDTIPQYEKIQLCFYMKFLNLDDAELVERYKDNMNIIPFNYNHLLYKQSLKILSRSIDYMYNLWTDSSEIKKYHSMTVDERNTYLNETMPEFEF